jgi:hypothetical protein
MKITLFQKRVKYKVLHITLLRADKETKDCPLISQTDAEEW